MTRDQLLQLLYADLSNTVGCTDIGAIGYAAAKAASLLEGELCRAELVLSDLLYKNALRVGVPGTDVAGVNNAILLGYLLCNPQKKLSVFEDAVSEDLDRLATLEKTVDINIERVERDDPMYIDLTLHTAQDHSVRVLLLQAYDHVQQIYSDNKLVFDAGDAVLMEFNDLPRRLDTNIDELYQFVQTESESLDRLLSLAKVNYNTARMGLSGEEASATSDLETAAALVRKHILSASGLRMKGAMVPVTGVAGSGNLGITTLTSVLVISKTLGANASATQQALALAVLISTYIKRKMGLLTTICGSSLAGGAAVSAATVFLSGGNLEQVKQAINMLISINAGTLCDGAKPSCAFKVGFSAENGVIAAKMALAGEGLDGPNGINKPDVEESIQNIADINNQALDAASAKILDII